MGHNLQKCCCNVKLNFTFEKEVMKGMEKILLLYINPEHIEMEITTSYNDTLKDLAFKKKKKVLVCPGN